MKLQPIFLIALIIFLMSCTKEVDLNLPDLALKPVINCLFSTNKPFNVNLCFPHVPNDTNKYYISNADVFIQSGNTDLLQLPYKNNGNYCESGFYPLPNIEYTIKIKIDSYPEIIAKSSIPSTQLGILSISTKSRVGFEAEMDVPYNEAKLFIKDFKSENYYGISEIYGDDVEPIKADTTESGSLTVWIYSLFSNDAAIETQGINVFYPDILVFNDKLFEGKTYNLKVNFYCYPESFKIFSFSPEAFNYIKSWIIHDYTKDYDFWEVYEPQPLYTNIENGYGIFAGYSSQVFEVWPDSTVVYK